MMKIVSTIAQEVFFNFCAAYNNRDLDSLMKLFTTNAIVWGTGIDEYKVGLKELEEQFKKEWSLSDECHITPSVHITTSKDGYSWGSCIFKVNIKINGQEHIFSNLRCSIVLEEEAGAWKIAHSHSSFPDIRQGAGESFPSSN